jgi:hypothetical protein
MAVSVSLSTRVSPELRQRLIAEARVRGLPLATLARDLLGAALDGAAFSAPQDGEVQNEVACVFHGLPLEAGMHRAVCMALARTVENGGAAGVTAGKELLDLTEWVRRRFEPEEEDEDDG